MPGKAVLKEFFMLKTTILAAALMVVFAAGCTSSPECDSSAGKDYVKKAMQAYAHEVGVKDAGIDIEGFKTLSANKDSCRCLATTGMVDKSANGDPRLRYTVEFELPAKADSRHYIEMVN